MPMRPFPSTWNQGDHIFSLHSKNPSARAFVWIDNKRQPFSQISFKDNYVSLWNKDTNGLTFDHLNHVYNPEVPGISNRLVELNWIPNVGFDLEYEFRDSKGKYLGNVQRRIDFETEKEPFRAYNGSFFLDPSIQGLGIADRIYRKQEDELFRPLASHPDSYVKVFANGDVGRYAWATKGFDFENKNIVNISLAKLSQFLRQHYPHKAFGGYAFEDFDNALYRLTGRRSNDLNHSWDFASLDDGREYSIDSNPKGFMGHLGKKFMIDYMPGWNGIKLLHPDSIHNKISNILEEAKKRKAQVI